ncbi:Uncharacterized protein NV38_0002554 [Leptospira kirschneri serovar Mozdok]|nr:Uncharacterized protein NV38_0002554 [Leptospira kirschneri serovar Mozdok]
MAHIKKDQVAILTWNNSRVVEKFILDLFVLD